MPENLTPVIPGQFYHVYNHAIGTDNLFVSDDNYIYFLKLIKKYLIPYSIIYSYILLPNHFHLLIKFSENDITEQFTSNQLSKLFNSYTQAFNKQQGRRGSLFIHRFKRKEVSNATYLKNLIIYINSNSRHHGLTMSAYDWKFSSLQAIIQKKPTLVDREFVIELFGDVENLNFCLSIDVGLDNDYTLE